MEEDMAGALAPNPFHISKGRIMSKSQLNTRKIASLGMLSAVATVLMFLSFSVPLAPSFLKLDFSELPALLAAFAYGPVSGAIVCLVKNLINALFTTTGGVGELSNFLLGVCFVVPAGLVYRGGKTRRRAFMGAFMGAVCMAILSLPINYFLVYPVYTAFMPMETILNLYRAIDRNVDSLFRALVEFNIPFTFVKAMLSTALAFMVYKPLSPILKGRK